MRIYNVYKVRSSNYYTGISIVAAESVDEVNLFIENQEGHEKCAEYDLMPTLISKEKGILYCGIRYNTGNNYSYTKIDYC